MTIRCAVLGDPIEHSLSPVLHNAGFAALGLTGWSYEAIRVPAGGLGDFLSGLSEQWRGLSLTMPLKRELVQLGPALTDRAARAQAANTLILEQPPLADNTDIPGAVAAIREKVAPQVPSATILGGGATATSVGLALLDLGVEQVTLAVREPSRAAETASQLRRNAAHLQLTVTTLAAWAQRPVESDLLVSTVPAAAQSSALIAAAQSSSAIFDVLYDPWPTPLAAAVRGRPLVSGLDLLVHQAAVQFELFTGHPAPVEAMRQAGLAALGLH